MISQHAYQYINIIDSEANCRLAALYAFPGPAGENVGGRQYFVLYVYSRHQKMAQQKY